MNTWILDTAIARLLSTNAVLLTEPPNSQIVGNAEAIFIFCNLNAQASPSVMGREGRGFCAFF
jgi:hypothetical protein